MKLSKLILPIIIAAALALIYYTYFASTDEIGSFRKFSTGSEVNQEINVMVIKSKGFVRDANGDIISFYVMDKNNIELEIVLHDPAPKEIINAEIVELLGHLHKNSFTVAKVSIIK